MGKTEGGQIQLNKEYWGIFYINPQKPAPLKA